MLMTALSHPTSLLLSVAAMSLRQGYHAAALSQPLLLRSSLWGKPPKETRRGRLALSGGEWCIHAACSFVRTVFNFAPQPYYGSHCIPRGLLVGQH